MSKILSFSSVYCDFKHDRIYTTQIVEDDNGKIKREKIIEDVVNYYYVNDPTNQSPIKDIYGNHVIKKIASDKYAMKDLKKSGIKLCEEDLPADMKWLHEKYEKLNLNPDIKNYSIAYLDIELESGSSFSKKIIDNVEYPINLISFRWNRNGKTYSFGNRPYEGLENYTYEPDEKELITKFMLFFRKCKVEIISGWNSDKFDVNYVMNRAKKLGVEESMSPIGIDYYNKRYNQWTIGGIALLDMMAFFRDVKFQDEKMSSYSLQNVSMQVLGKGKTEFDGQINDLYKRDWELYVRYNRVDCELVEELEAKKKYIELAVILAHKSLIPFEKVFSAISMAEGQMLTFLHADNMVMPNRKPYKNDAPDSPLEFVGGFVSAEDGYYTELTSYDATSLYPTIISMLNVSPETLCLKHLEENEPDFIRTTLKGICYKREKGILPKIIDLNFKERKEFKDLANKYKAEGNDELYKFNYSQQLIRKYFLNSIFGICGHQAFHFYDVNLAKTITETGQHIIKYVQYGINEYFKNYFYKNSKYFSVIDEKNSLKENLVPLMDTDSIFLNIKKIKDLVAPNDNLLEWNTKFDKEFMTPFINKMMDQYFKKNYGIENRMTFKLEKVISQMVIFGKKNYATVVIANEGVKYKKPEMTVTGFASKRSDRPYYCRKKINEMLDLFFETHDESKMLDAFRDIKKDFKKQEIEAISKHSGITDYDKYAQPYEVYAKNGLSFQSATPIHARASIIYNFIIQSKNLPYQLIYSGSKINHIYVHPNNEYKTNVIGYIGNYPEQFKSIFKIDYETQFEKTFLEAMQTLFDALRWGKVNLENRVISFIE